MAEQRLPIVNSDDGVWGDILRQYLMKEHYNDDTNNAANGGHQNVTITAGTTTKAPLTFTSSSSLLSTPAAGAVEFDTDTLYFTITTGGTRKKIPLIDVGSPGATGDLYYRDSSGNFVRLGIGSSGQTLKVASGIPAWSSTNTNSGFTVGSHSGSYTVTGTDTVILADASSGNTTITLPAASGLGGYRFYIKRTDSSGNTCTIARTSSDTIDGATSQTLNIQYQAIAVVSDGSSAWYIL